MATLDELVNVDLITIAGNIRVQAVGEDKIHVLFDGHTDDLASTMFNDGSIEAGALMDSPISWIYQDGDTLVFDIDWDDYAENLKHVD